MVYITGDSSKFPLLTYSLRLTRRLASMREIHWAFA